MTHQDRTFERIGAERVYAGRFISVDRERFRFADGEEADREIIRHPGAVGIVAHDGEHLWLVRQPRETVMDPDVLEIPAGKLDAGEDPLECGPRELAEEIGKAAGHWEHLTSFHSSIGITDEIVHVYLATGLSEAHAEADTPHAASQLRGTGENERIEIVRWPLADLDGALAATHDAKTIIGLLLLRERLRSDSTPHAASRPRDTGA